MLTNLLNSARKYGQYLAGRPTSQPLPQREMYRMLESYYLNNGLYDGLAQTLYQNGIWKEALRGLRNPAMRVTEFYVSHLWPGQLPKALPIVTDNNGVAEAIADVWDWSNWGHKKQVGARWLAMYGDLFIKAVSKQDVLPDGQFGEVEQVYLQLIKPEHVTDFDTDHRDFLTYIRLDVPQRRRLADGSIETYIHTEVWDKASQLYRVWQHDKSPELDLEQLGRPMVEAGFAQFGIDFVPFVHSKFRDIGDDRGVGCFTLELDKIDEANRQATRLSQMLFRWNKPLWALSANAVDTSGRPMPAPRIGGESGPAGVSDTIALGDDRLMRLPGTSKLESLIPNINFQAALEVLKDHMSELKDDLPELIYYDLEVRSDQSGAGIRALLGPAVDKVIEARGDAETALARANAMALTMGANAGLFQNIGSYEAGDFEHQFGERPVIEESEAEKAGASKIYVDMGVPKETALRRQGWGEDELAQMAEDENTARTAQQSQLAQAVLEAQRRLDSGQADNGLTQPEDGQPEEIE